MSDIFGRQDDPTFDDDQASTLEGVDTSLDDPQTAKRLTTYNDVDTWAPLRRQDDEGKSVIVPDDTSYRAGERGGELSDDYLVAKLDEFDARISEALYTRKARLEVVKAKFRDLAARIAGEENRVRWNKRRGPLVDDETRNLVNAQLYEEHTVAGMILLAMGVVAGLAIFSGAIFADYKILSELWTRSLMNEFMVVPDTLKDSVVSKSLQVIFATMAVHFLLTKLTRTGRRVFVAVLFGLTVMMLVSIGVLNSTTTERIDVNSRGIESSENVDDTLAALGLAEASAPVVAATPVETTPDVRRADVAGPVSTAVVMDWLRTYSWDVWFMGIFLVVTAVGAFALHESTVRLNRLMNFGGKETRGRLRNQLEALQEEYHCHTNFVDEMRTNDAREQLVRRYLGHNINEYVRGSGDGNADAEPNLRGVYMRTLENWHAFRQQTADDLAEKGFKNVRKAERQEKGWKPKIVFGSKSA